MVSTLPTSGKENHRSGPSQCPTDPARPLFPPSRAVGPLGSIPRVSSNDAIPGAAGAAVPPPLQVAAALAGVEAGALLLQGITLVPALEGQRMAMGLTTVVFFLAYGAGLAWCAVQLRRRRSWARSPVVFAQLIQLGVASSFWGGQTTYVAVALGLVALIVLAGVFHPQSLRALDNAPD